MSETSPVMIIAAGSLEDQFARQLANALGYAEAHLVIGGPLDAANALSRRNISPTYIVLDIGERNADVLPELDVMAEFCDPYARVVVLGTINDVQFYRLLKQRGIAEYFTHPVSIGDIRVALTESLGRHAGGKGSGAVIAFMSAASGDGASTVALNTAYCLAQEYEQPTVLVDMDYQFGMIARNLDLASPYGIKDIFEHPERGIDATLLERMLIPYGERLKVIASPNELKMLPPISPEVVRELIVTLREQSAFVILDLPHVWANWVSAALSNATHVCMVAQLWLRSVTHSSRLLKAWYDIGIESHHVSVVINRSGAKFKEAVTAKDFERVSGKKIDYYLANDVKTISAAENQGKTLLEVGGGALLERQVKELAQALMRLRGEEIPAKEKIKPGRASIFGGKVRK